MAKKAEMKDCRNVDRDMCDRQIPLGSKHDFCLRCRRYDALTADRDPEWLRGRYKNLTRWRCTVIAHAPKDVQKLAEETPVRLRPSIAQIRKFPAPPPRRTSDATPMRRRA